MYKREDETARWQFTAARDTAPTTATEATHLDGEGNADEQKQRALAEVLVPRRRFRQILTLLRQLRDLVRHGQGRPQARHLRRVGGALLALGARAIRRRQRLRHRLGAVQRRQRLLQRRYFVPHGALPPPLPPQQRRGEGQREGAQHGGRVEEGAGPAFKNAPVRAGGVGGEGGGEGRRGGGEDGCPAAMRGAGRRRVDGREVERVERGDGVVMVVVVAEAGDLHCAGSRGCGRVRRGDGEAGSVVGGQAGEEKSTDHNHGGKGDRRALRSVMVMAVVEQARSLGFHI